MHAPGLRRWAVTGCMVLLAGLYARYDWLDPRRPEIGTLLTQGWWTFSDQGRYLADTLAWAAGDLTPSRHYYLPGYALLGVPFVHLTPANPFLLPDLGLLLTASWLTACLAEELLPDWRLARPVGAAAFTATAALPATMEVWVTPWTTSPAVPLTLGCLLALTRFTRQPGSWRLALAGALCASSILAFRPTDGALMLALTALAGGTFLLLARPGWRRSMGVAAAAAIGAVVPAAVTGLLYGAEHGWTVSPYLEFSGYIGFEWRLLPLQWVTLVLSPQPMLPDGTGMLAVFPFIATGLAGMAACLVAPPGQGRRSSHAIVVAAAVAHGALYLCYRDLHPPGFWRYYNYHYFKWLLPVFGLYTVMLAMALKRPGSAVAAAALLIAVLPWRAQTEVLPVKLPHPDPGSTLALPPGLGIGTGLAAAAAAPFDSVYNGVNHFYLGTALDHWYGSVGRIAAYPLPQGLMLVPVDELFPGPGLARLDAGVALDPASSPRMVRLALSYGRPCFLPAWVPGGASCLFDSPLTAPARPLGVPIPFDAEVKPLLSLGWDRGGLADEWWTEGGRAGLRLQLDPVPTGGATLVVDATAFIPGDSGPMDVAVEAGGITAGRWHLTDAAPHSLRMALPASAFSPDGTLRLVFAIANPRRPAAWLPHSDDRRLLGLRVRSVMVQGAP